MNFKKDISFLKEILKNELFVSSDHHFGHLNIYEKFEPCRKELAPTLDGFEKKMVEFWNDGMKKNSTIIHLGDFCINKMNEKTTIENIIKNTQQLNGLKILVKGNHDIIDNSVYYAAGWNYVVDKPHILIKGKETIIPSSPLCGCIIMDIFDVRVMFSHFGLFSYDDRFENKYKQEFLFLEKLFTDYECNYNIHGHMHSNSEHSNFSYNACVEKNEFKPVSLKKIAKDKRG